MRSETKGPEQGLPADKLRVLVAFEGGGAKGIAHVGALKALTERPELEIRGFSGTSAGAIVAALAAAGFEADDLVDHRRGVAFLKWCRERDLCGYTRATQLFGGNWWRIVVFRWALGFLGPDGENRRRSILAGTLTALLVLSVPLVAGALSPQAAVAIVTVAIVVTAAAVSLGIGYAVRGLASLTRVRWLVSRAIATRLGFPPEHDVTFRELHERRGVSLKIVAADLPTRSLKLFSTGSPTEDEPIAEAVAASICLPVIFAPWRGRFVDGGLVSNLPVWPFDEDRALDPDTKTIAVEIEDEPLTGDQPRRGNWLTNLIRTAIFGGALLDKRAIDNLHVINLRTDLDLLDFDAKPERLFEAVERAEAQARNQIRRRIVDGPALVRETNRRVLARMSERLAARGKEQRVRVAIARPDGGAIRSLRLRHCVGFDDDIDTDESILLPVDGSVVGESWVNGLGYLVENPRSEDEWLSGPENRWARRKISKTLEWVLTIPIFSAILDDESHRNRTPSFVVVVDGSGNAPEDGDMANESLGEFMDAAGQAYRQLLPIIEDLDDA